MGIYMDMYLPTSVNEAAEFVVANSAIQRAPVLSSSPPLLNNAPVHYIRYTYMDQPPPSSPPPSGQARGCLEAVRVASINNNQTRKVKTALPLWRDGCLPRYSTYNALRIEQRKNLMTETTAELVRLRVSRVRRCD
ncbi:hypothetical protein CCM_04025 [Cordyceps militaris CM01]|uniref:Uncharacterized protein n=1 Tax=Cordyceps militaris (strain CM01) TaxID=983644 RepID=G3JDH7_CORMM|nr:uncharacterized protein CCM_04025 [Cordyceps militaris CM01]EGX92652.1 hypothetical protein CCM_04025 [Cordyceps militaris CM01]